MKGVCVMHMDVHFTKGHSHDICEDYGFVDEQGPFYDRSRWMLYRQAQRCCGESHGSHMQAQPVLLP